MSTLTTPVDPLTDEEKSRIRRDEIYRQAIRDELKVPGHFGDLVWRFLNSGFGLWLFSALFVTWGVNLYSDHRDAAREMAQKAEAERKESARVKELTERLDLEISYRLSFAMTRLEAANRATDGALPEPKRIRVAVAAISSPMSEEMPPLFPEFRAYSGPALIAELRRHVPEQQDLLKEKLASLTGLLDTIETGSDGKPFTVVSFAGELIARLKNSRWDNGFYYTDCSREQPFC
jgi:hypothetical protein